MIEIVKEKDRNKPKRKAPDADRLEMQVRDGQIEFVTLADVRRELLEAYQAGTRPKNTKVKIDWGEVSGFAVWSIEFYSQVDIEESYSPVELVRIDEIPIPALTSTREITVTLTALMDDEIIGHIVKNIERPLELTMRPPDQILEGFLISGQAIITGVETDYLDFLAGRRTAWATIVLAVSGDLTMRHA